MDTQLAKMAKRISFDIRSQIARSFLPQDCFLCGAASADKFLCDACARELPTIEAICPQCAMPSPGAHRCGDCLAHPPHFDATIAAFRYDFPVDRMVQSLKYGGRLALAAWFAAQLAQRLHTRPHPDLLIAMPLHGSRLKERGFNQSWEIARRIALILACPLDARLARRTRATAPQVELAPGERARNVRGAFSCDADLDGRTVAVVDDVMTSGATLNELARTLKRAGASRVDNWVVARAVTRA